MATTSTSQPSRSLLETLQVFSNRSTKRQKLDNDPVEHFVELAPTLLHSSASNSDRKRNDDSENQKKSKYDYDKTHTKKDSCKSDEWQGDVERYQKRLEREREEMEAIARTREELKKEQVELWGVYKYGLKQIIGLNDLGDAPDAILPGNF